MMVSILGEILPWYVAVQLCAIASLPLAVRFFADLPDRGFVFAKTLGILLVGVSLWLGTSYGLLRNEFGGALIALGAVTAIAYSFGGYRALRRLLDERSSTGRGWLVYIVSAELLFVFGFGIWAYVRAHDPAANHTEQPMDLMFMNSIWTSPTYPPRDAWLAGYPISYYYLGYWLLTTLGHLSSTPPAVAYNVGQASWYGLLLVMSFGLGFNLHALASTRFYRSGSGSTDDGDHYLGGMGASLIAGLLTAMFVAVIGNLQVIVEWFYARGADLSGLASWLAVNGFPENAQQSGRWYIDYSWWWWRSSRVLSDQDLLGNHMEVIDEFPMFSYVLGDNHPHVLAMPVVILVVGMALTLYLSASRARPLWTERMNLPSIWHIVVASVPFGYGGVALIAVVSGALVFLNTWDYPPYWLLLIASVFVGVRSSVLSDRRPRFRPTSVAALAALYAGVFLGIATIIIYLPYFMTAQSQAGGFIPNLFNPSRLQQVMLMFGVFVPAIAALLIWMWGRANPSATNVGISLAAVFGVPIGFLGLSVLIASGTERGRSAMARMALPPDTSSHLPFVLDRWTTRPYTFLLFGFALAVCLALIWTALTRATNTENGVVGLFVLLLTALALLLVYLPEFVYLRDNFGTRMNTVFKFYYQAWLLMAVVAAFTVSRALFAWERSVPIVARVLATVTLVASLMALVFPAAAVYSKTTGFAADQPTLDATQYVRYENPAESLAIEWVQTNTLPEDIVLEGKGASYRASHNRISTATGRPTLLGWEGHESQWRGEAYAEMAGGRAEALDQIYRTAEPEALMALLQEWDIAYVYVGQTEREQYGITPAAESRLAEVMELVFSNDGVSIYRRR